MKKKLLTLFFGPRAAVFKILFTEQERTAVINALWRRTTDERSNKVKAELQIVQTCENLAKELL